MNVIINNDSNDNNDNHINYNNDNNNTIMIQYRLLSRAKAGRTGRGPDKDKCSTGLI